MSDTAFILQNCTRALSGAEDAIHLLEQKSRLEQAVSSGDPALTLDTSKSLLESIFKTILTDRQTDLNFSTNFSTLYTEVRGVIALNNDADANEILKRLTNSIVHNVGELRNKYGAASHGDDGYSENPIEMPEAEMVAHIVDGMGGFLFRKHKNLNDPELAQRIFYGDYDVFNDWLDSQNDPIEIPVEEAKKIPFSIFLFTYDVDTYRAMLLQYIQTEEEDAADSDEGAQIVEPSIVQSKTKIEDDFWAVPEAVPETVVDPTEDIIASLLVNKDVNSYITEDECTQLAVFVQDYAQTKAGLDWQNREALIAKFRIQLKRQLHKINFPASLIDLVAERIIKKAKKHYPSKGGGQ